MRLTFSSSAGAMFAEVAGARDWRLYPLDNGKSWIEGCRLVRKDMGYARESSRRVRYG